jgi:hypothetical protein
MRRSIPCFAIALAGLSCSPEPVGPLDALAPPPVLISVSPSGVIVNTDTMNVGGTRLPTDVLQIPVTLSALVQTPAGTAPVANVSAWIADDRGDVIDGPFEFNDRGVWPDQTAGDGRFSGEAHFSIIRVEVGTWSARVGATGVNGTRSTTAVVPVSIVRNNRPPVISNLTAAASISASDPQPLMLLTVKAVDPDGASDIVRVSFDSFRPTGQPASGNPFVMFDDGNTGGISGDAVARDSVYSLRVQFGGAPTGIYRFEFRAIDRSSDSSNVIIHHVEVLP